jgi:hypothetical protein
MDKTNLKVETLYGRNGSVASWVESDNHTELLNDEIDYCFKYNKVPVVILITEMSYINY